MSDFEHDAGSTTVLDVTLPPQARQDGGSATGRLARGLAQPVRVTAVTLGILGVCALGLWVGSEAIEWTVTAGQRVIGEVGYWLAAWPRALAMGAC